MGLGYALTEGLMLDAEGGIINASLKKCRMLKAGQMPEVKVELIEAGEESGPYGAKGVGECATVPVAPAVVNAVCNALKREIRSLPVVRTRGKYFSNLKQE